MAVALSPETMTSTKSPRGSIWMWPAFNFSLLRTGKSPREASTSLVGSELPWPTSDRRGSYRGISCRTLPSWLVFRRLQLFRHLHSCSGCFRLERLPGGPCTHWKAPPFHGAHPEQTNQGQLLRPRGRRVQNWVTLQYR